MKVLSSTSAKTESWNAQTSCFFQGSALYKGLFLINLKYQRGKNYSQFWFKKKNPGVRHTGYLYMDWYFWWVNMRVNNPHLQNCRCYKTHGIWMCALLLPGLQVDADWLCLWMGQPYVLLISGCSLQLGIILSISIPAATQIRKAMLTVMQKREQCDGEIPLCKDKRADNS